MKLGSEGFVRSCHNECIDRELLRCGVRDELEPINQEGAQHGPLRTEATWCANREIAVGFGRDVKVIRLRPVRDRFDLKILTAIRKRDNNWNAVRFVAVNLLGGPPSLLSVLPDLFSLTAATSNARHFWSEGVCAFTATRVSAMATEARSFFMT